MIYDLSSLPRTVKTKVVQNDKHRPLLVTIALIFTGFSAWNLLQYGSVLDVIITRELFYFVFIC
jgi:hypothetical protein